MFLCAGLYIDNFPVQYGKNWYTSYFWSLAVEEQFYFIFPILIIKRISLYLSVIISIIFSLPFIVWLGHANLDTYHNHELLYKGTLSLTYLFGYGTSSILIGSLFSILIFKGIIKIKDKYPYYLSASLFIILLSVRAITASNIIVINNYFGFFTVSYLYAVLIAAIIILNLKNNLFSNLLNNKYIVKIGILSYSIYIWQQLFTYDQPWSNSFKYGSSIILNMFVLLLISYCSYFLYEKRFLQLKKRFVY